jgi:hypothetical protein
MLEDSVLVCKMKHGSSDALRRIYEKYKRDMLLLSNTLLYNLKVFFLLVAILKSFQGI